MNGSEKSEWVAVIFNGRTERNPFGHSAIAFQNAGVYSFGNDTKIGTSLESYLKREAPRRDSWVFLLQADRSKVLSARTYLDSLAGTPVEVAPDNCARRTNEALRRLGYKDVSNPYSTFMSHLGVDTPLPENTAVMGGFYSRGISIKVPKGTAGGHPMFKDRILLTFQRPGPAEQVN